MRVLFSILCLCLFACGSDSISSTKNVSKLELPLKSNTPVFEFVTIKPLAFTDSLVVRQDITSKMLHKKEEKKPLVVHAFVPLCDNEHQGIVPTTESLGNGFSLRSNLYWATSNGMKKFFQKRPWYHISENDFVANDTVLERVVFERHFEDCKVILICDAYRGDMMEPCLKDYLSSLAGRSQDSVSYANSRIDLNKDVDMVVFNGHNGLMDVDIDPVLRNPQERFFKRKDAVVIACASKSYFIPHFLKTDSYPLVTTTSLLYPGAFILDGIIDKWARMQSEEDIKNAAGDAYHKVKECGKQAARNMFDTGW